MENQAEKKLKVLITSPSLDEKENVSGISTVVREIVKHSDCEFTHFVAGRKDKEKAGVFWLLKQIFLPFRFSWLILWKKIDVIHINTALTTLSIVRDFALILTAKFFGFPVLLHPNGGEFLFKKIPSNTLNWLTGEMFYMADKVLILSENEKKRILDDWKNLGIDILPNAIGTDEIEFSEKENNPKNIIFFGRIDENKGLKEIVEACRILKSENFEFHFKCYGKGPQENEFIAEMKKVLGEQFDFCGVVSGKDKWKALADADIFLLPSYFEGLPLSILEAMAAKCIVIVTDVGSIKTVIENGKNGFLINPHSAEEVIEKIKLVFSKDFDWEKMQNNARKTIEEKYSIEKYVVKLKEIYEEITQ